MPGRGLIAPLPSDYLPFVFLISQLAERRRSVLIFCRWCRLVAIAQTQGIDSPRFLPRLFRILTDRWLSGADLLRERIDSQIFLVLTLHFSEGPAHLVCRFLGITLASQLGDIYDTGRRPAP